MFPDAAALKANTSLGRLNVSKASGDIDGDGDFDRIDVFGARSVSIRDSQGRLIWDSGELFERLSEKFNGTLTVFNTTNTANTLKNRSDDKGIEPESVVVGEVKGKPYAFVGLERDGGIVVLDLSKPSQPAFVTYATNRKLPRDAAGALLPCNEVNNCGDLRSGRAHLRAGTPESDGQGAADRVQRGQQHDDALAESNRPWSLGGPWSLVPGPGSWSATRARDRF